MGVRAAITPGNNIIQTDKYSELSYDSLGYLHSFKVGSTIMVYCEHKDFMAYKNPGGKMITGYYPKDKYEEYLRKEITIDEFVTKYNYFTKLKLAQPGDNVIVRQLTVNPPFYLQQLMVTEYTWDFQYSDKLFTNDIYQNLIIPQRALNNPHNSAFIENPDQITIDFLDYNVNLIGDQSDEGDMKTVALILNKIAANIDFIIKNVFPLFSDNPEFVTYMDLQKQEWRESDRFQELNKDQLNSYLGAIRNFRIKASVYRAEIDNDEGLDNITKLALLFSSNTLSVFPAKSRIKILDDLIAISLSEWVEKTEEENLVVKIIQSFSYNNTETINQFLDELSRANRKGSKETLYEILYNRMSKSWNITEMTYGLVNWVFKAHWKPTDTRAAFVKSVYVLWVLSDNNPYDLSTGLLKPNTIGIKKNVLGLTIYETDEIDENGDPETSVFPQNKRFYYTRYKGYERYHDSNISWSHDIYREKYHDACSINLNYESKKEHGVYNDNGVFKFDGDEIKVYLNYLRVESDGQRYEDVFMGRYKLFQPVQLVNENIDTIMPLPTITGENIEAVKDNNGKNVNSVIPIFLIHYVDRAGDSSDMQIALGIMVDILSTFIPVGNLTKLKHLRHLSKLEIARVVIGVVEFSAGVLSFMLNYVDGCDTDGFCKRLKTFLFWVEMSSLSADALTSRMARNSAKEITNNGFPLDFDNDLAKMEIENLAQHADTLLDLERMIEVYSKDVRKLIDERINADFNGIFSKKHYANQFSDSDLRDLISQCLNMQIANKIMIADFVAMACRAKKKSTRLELLTQITYFKKVILVKGFPSGFASLEDFKIFCLRIRAYFESFDDFSIDFIDLRVQGSTIKQRYFNDPLDPNNIPYLTRDGNIVNPEDIDIDILVTQANADKYAEKAKLYWEKRIAYFKSINNDKVLLEISSYPKRIDDGMKKGIIHGYLMPPRTSGGNFLDDLRSVQKRSDGSDIFMPKSSKYDPPISEVNASIIIKGSSYDISPTMSFKY